VHDGAGRLGCCGSITPLLVLRRVEPRKGGGISLRRHGQCLVARWSNLAGVNFPLEVVGPREQLTFETPPIAVSKTP
jgi:hypothetical protein